ncbi:DUF2637 domain-containing protein [Mycobacterium heckeshornense]|uniref:DUF2637 domain-containing protein n=1 Tax=Mycobacterium heckeshornense TaxID=110505 RepID=UPI00066277A1|nr:DUF2637 domain-containing protein [Mycobacterium heckeshornense]
MHDYCVSESLINADFEAAAAEDEHHRRAALFFRAVLIVASSASIAGNAAHAVVATNLGVPAPLAAAVAVAPPVILMSSIEGLSLLIRTSRRSKATFWCALAMTALLALCAFVLSFEALRDLAIRSGIAHELAWLWPVVVDVTIAQATMALLALSRSRSAITLLPSLFDDDTGVDGVNSAIAAGARDRWVGLGAITDDHAQRALAIVRSGRIRQTPETVKTVLELEASGAKANEIATQTRLHHSTVRRILVTAARSRASDASNNGAERNNSHELSLARSS